MDPNLKLSLKTALAVATISQNDMIIMVQEQQQAIVRPAEQPSNTDIVNCSWEAASTTGQINTASSSYQSQDMW